VTVPESGINLHAVYVRNDNAFRVIAGFKAALPAMNEMWQQVDRALADVPTMGAAIARLTAELAGMRMDHANLLAAMRAAIAAHADGETDPLWYIRDAIENAGGAHGA
jgi:hypothetical protein